MTVGPDVDIENIAEIVSLLHSNLHLFLFWLIRKTD